MDNTHGTDSDDAIAALVRLAGRRPPVAQEMARRVRDAVHDEWMETIRRRLDDVIAATKSLTAD